MNRKEERLRMVQQQVMSEGIADTRVIEAMMKVPRHLFVPESLREHAYQGSPIPIGAGQTISQPSMVALMTQSLDLQGDEKVLEIGTGSGYQTAILAELADTVYTIERIVSLSQEAQARLRGLGYRTIMYKVGDGTHGWPEKGPFDAIVVTAAAPLVSHVLAEQLHEEGRMVIPVGSLSSQRLVRLIKQNHSIYSENLSGCVFVPLIGDYGYGV